uniref:mucin-3A n=1 Tax=Scatophagus argus TaxID=75038 RepID=UPI001ED84140|nr:mucin-3A [Scatophagus argus]
MTIDFISLIFIWLLPLTASSTVTSGQHHIFTDEMTEETGKRFTHSQLTTQETSNLNPLSEDSGENITQSISIQVNRTEEKATKPSTESSLQTTETALKTLSPNIHTEASPTYSMLLQLKSSTVAMMLVTEVRLKVPTSSTMVINSPVSHPTATSRILSMLRSSTQSQYTRQTQTFQFASDKITHPSTHPTPSTNFLSSKSTSTKPGENKYTSTSTQVQAQSQTAKQSTGMYKTSPATTKTPFIHITRAKKGQGSQEKKATSKNKMYHSKIVAGVIGGALVFMIAGFLFIYIKKRKLQTQKITSTEWAGPSPFLEGGADYGQVTKRSSNRISLTSFLPQRMSKRLSLLPETDEELQDMTPGTTFGGKHQETISGREVNENDVQESNGTAAVVSEMKQEETVENSVSASSFQTNHPLSTNNNSEVKNPSEDHSINYPTVSTAMERE